MADLIRIVTNLCISKLFTSATNTSFSCYHTFNCPLIRSAKDSLDIISGSCNSLDNIQLIIVNEKDTWHEKSFFSFYHPRKERNQAFCFQGCLEGGGGLYRIQSPRKRLTFAAS